MNKSRLTAILFFTIITSVLSAQISQIENYLNKTGSHATLFSGELETGYSTIFYEGQLPYHQGQEYRKGTLWTHQNEYPNQQMRLDLYRDQLILLAPEVPHGVIIPSKQVKELTIENTHFIFLPSDNNMKLNTGYYISIYQGNELNLLCREAYILNTPSDKPKSYFSQNKKYYLVHSNGTTVVKNRKSFTRLFPQHKKKIKEFSKTNRLNFKRETNESMRQLAAFIEKLLTQKNNL